MDPQRTIKERREALGMSQAEFAAALGISVRTVQNWEGGGGGKPRRTPRVGGMVEQAIARLEASHARRVRRAEKGDE